MYVWQKVNGKDEGGREEHADVAVSVTRLPIVLKRNSSVAQKSQRNYYMKNMGNTQENKLPLNNIYVSFNELIETHLNFYFIAIIHVPLVYVCFGIF